VPYLCVFVCEEILKIYWGHLRTPFILDLLA